MTYFIQGFMLGLAYVAPLGMQNIYVINSAVSNTKVKAYSVALITAFFDISLALACFFGIGALMEKFELLKLVILLIGSIAIIFIGVKLIKTTPDAKGEVDLNKTMLQIIVTCFLVTWANPQALIDGSLLLGGFKATLTFEAANLFIIGVSVASLSWFLGVTTVVSVFKNSINNKVLKVINVICGSILILFGLKLIYSFIEIIL
jgi:L-lysine exporter family protein LysE/ArgO